jgi:hypothetical protein
MPSGAPDPQPGEERIHTAAMSSGGAAQGDHLGGIEAVLQAGAGAAGAALGGARSGARPAMHPATAVLHRWLAAAAAGAGLGAAARRGQEIAGLGTVPQAASAVWRKAGGRRARRK